MDNLSDVAVGEDVGVLDEVGRMSHPSGVAVGEDGGVHMGEVGAVTYRYSSSSSLLDGSFSSMVTLLSQTTAKTLLAYTPDTDRTSDKVEKVTDREMEPSTDRSGLLLTVLSCLHPAV